MRSASHRLVSCSRREVPQPIPEHTAKLANAALSVLKPLLKQTADALQAEVKPEQRWCERVKAYDGTTVTMSDTICQPASYPPTAINWSVWLSVGKSGGVVFVTTGAVGSCSGVYHECEEIGTATLCHPPRRCRCSRFCLWHVCGPGFSPFSKCRCRVSETSCASL